jgi:DNA-binding NarL/FixJ family response regulator
VNVRVLIVDDTEFMRDGIRMALEPAPGIEVAGEAADGAAGVAAAERLRPDVVLMDVRMPVLDGIDATRAIVALDGPPVRVLMLTTFDLDEYLLEALAAGVSGFTLKDTPPDELVAGIEAGRSNAEIGVGGDEVAALLARLGVRDRIHAVVAAHEARVY